MGPKNGGVVIVDEVVYCALHSIFRSCNLIPFPVVLDVNRSLKRFPPGIEEAARPGLQEQLTRLIIRVMLAQPSLHYYQGYHDVAITFLLVVGEEPAFQIMERLSMSHLQDFMAPTMEQTMGLLELLYPLVRRTQPRLHEHLVKAELGTIFALPWSVRPRRRAARDTFSVQADHVVRSRAARLLGRGEAV